MRTTMIFFNVRLTSELPLATELARRAMLRGEAVTFCSEDASENTAPFIRKAAEALGADYGNLELAVSRSSPKLGFAASLLWWAIKWRLPAAYSVYVALHRQIETSKDMLRSASADILVVFQDGVSGNGAMIKAARDLGIPVLDIPYGFGTSRDFHDYLQEKDAAGQLHRAQGFVGWAVRTFAAKWLREGWSGNVLLYPADYILVRELLDLSLDLPWVVHGGQADILTAESDRMLSHYRAEGIREAKLKLTGTVYCDAMADVLAAFPELKAAYDTSKKIKPDRTSLLLSLPPDYHETRPGKNEFQTYQELIGNVIGMVNSRPDIDCTVSLHPGMLPQHRSFIESMGVDISDEWILTLIPKHDILFTAFSSTIRWAIACGKPVVNYNMYDYSCRDYADVDDVYTTTKFSEAKDRVFSLADDKIFEEACFRQKKAGQEWGIMDGKNFDRIHEVVRSLIAERKENSGRQVRKGVL